jgi:hypothetical protein
MDQYRTEKDDGFVDPDDKAEALRAEAADNLGAVLISVLADQAGDRCPELRAVYGIVQVVAETTDPEYCEVIGAHHRHWEVMLDLRTAPVEFLVVPVPPEDCQTLYEAASKALGRRVVAIVAPSPVEDVYGRNDGTLVALIVTPVDAPGVLVEVAACGRYYGIGWDVWPCAMHFVKPY